ncbi:hypothetical protein Desaci_2889 [Desulfosporosinus acidiphilus SJ4]|uniref:Uncharacterized protein n=1 Tax=Desulfosporosinus acidiphilus (strain DSM 22704 / JCM 16185 / SJ4) TaxID=646529 RepID=I4D7M7_DESAJ|nr:hypothetical protein [Desulfosporosinus acidiphilus]AFM41801.1 hypothetical protein Desaci_2889 [Desulfosporosinus acidiphilus SJ4]
MDDRIEEIKPISSIRPTRKLAFADPQKGEGEQMYQFNRFKKLSKRKGSFLVAKKRYGLSTSGELNPEAISEEVKDIKNRLAYDRARIIGDK